MQIIIILLDHFLESFFQRAILRFWKWRQNFHIHMQGMTSSSKLLHKYFLSLNMIVKNGSGGTYWSGNSFYPKVSISRYFFRGIRKICLLSCSLWHVSKNSWTYIFSICILLEDMVRYVHIGLRSSKTFFHIVLTMIFHNVCQLVISDVEALPRGRSNETSKMQYK